MFFARPYRKIMEQAVKDVPIFEKQMFSDYKVKDCLQLYYCGFQSYIHNVTGGGTVCFKYEKRGVLRTEIDFRFLMNDARAEDLKYALDVIPDDGFDDMAIYEEKNHKPEPRSVVVFTIEDVDKESLAEAMRRSIEAIEDLLDAYTGEDEEEE